MQSNNWKIPAVGVQCSKVALQRSFMLVGGLQLLEVASEGVDNLLDAPVLTFFVFLIIAKSLAHGAHELEQF